VATGDRVGIYLNRSLAAVVAMFGILKAGAAYVPIDPATPVRRVVFIIADCGIKALITAQSRIGPL
jgi:acyl-CoA synthetase (AMP-forming)/AMP-acid ligase II